MMSQVASLQKIQALKMPMDLKIMVLIMDLLHYRGDLALTIYLMMEVLLRVVNGTYTTRFPLVWASNAYSNNGVQTAGFSTRNAAAGCDPTANPALVSATMPQCVKDAIAVAPLSDSTIVSLSPDFEWPTMKVLNVTYEKPMGDWFVVASYLKKDYEQAVYKVLNTGDALVGNQAPIPGLRAPDGRPIYNMDTYNSFKVALNNQGGGGAEIFTIGASRAFNDGDSEFSINYTNQNIDEITSGTSQLLIHLLVNLLT